MGTEGQPIPQGGHHGGGLKQLRLPGEGKVRGDDGTGFLAAVRDYLEQQLGLVAVEAEIAQLVQNQQVGLGKGSLQLAQSVAILVLTQLGREGDGILEEDVVPLAAGFQPTGNGQMGLAPAGIADHHHVAPILDKLAGGKLMEKGRGDGRIELGQVELVQGILKGETLPFEPVQKVSRHIVQNRPRLEDCPALALQLGQIVLQLAYALLVAEAPLVNHDSLAR